MTNEVKTHEWISHVKCCLFQTTIWNYGKLLIHSSVFRWCDWRIINNLYPSEHFFVNGLYSLFIEWSTNVSGKEWKISCVTLTHSSDRSRAAADEQLYRLLLPSLASHVDLFMLKCKQLEAQLALPLGMVDLCIHRRELSRVFSALGKPVSGSGSNSTALQIKVRFRLMDRRPFSDDCGDVWLLIAIMGIFRRGGVTW